MLDFQHVTKQFGDETYALEDVTFLVEPGELVFITGPSGAGKTTLMRLLTKEYQPTEGEIIFNQTPLSEISRGKTHLLRRDIGVIFQDYKLVYDLNVWENISLALEILGKSNDEIEERVSDLLQLVGLNEKAFLFPSQLSGGEAQRVSIARALATAPKLIFADEPTGNLDPVTSLHIAKLLEKINELGTTILFSTHDQAVLHHFGSTRRLELEQGKLVKDTKKKASSSTSKAKATSEELDTEKVEAKVDAKVEKNEKEDEKPSKTASETPTDTPEKELEPEETKKKDGWGFNPFGAFKKKASSQASEESSEETSDKSEAEEKQKVEAKAEEAEEDEEDTKSSKKTKK